MRLLSNPNTTELALAPDQRLDDLYDSAAMDLAHRMTAANLQDWKAETV